jgi:hypothetical protein
LYLATSLSNLSEIEKALRYATSLPYFIAILTTATVGDPILDPDVGSVDERQLESLCHSTSAIIVNAYDDEGYLVWYRQPKPV